MRSRPALRQAQGSFTVCDRSDIPDARQHLTRYQGAYANAARGLYRPAEREEQQGEKKVDVPLEEECIVSTLKAQRRRSWARLLRRIYEVDPLRCSCGGELKIVSVITDPLVVDRILLHRKGKRLKSPFSSRSPPGT